MSKITFVLGGARSGKSSHALFLSGRARRPAFVATCEALDREMSVRIRRHREERPKRWATFEEPLKVAETIKSIPADRDFILIDCLTLFVSNLLLKKKSAEYIEAEVASIVEAIKGRKSAAVIVSNEVGLGIVPDNRLGRQFRDIAGAANKLVAGMSDTVIFMVSGIPWRIK